MVYKDKNLIFATFQVVTPSLKNLNNGQKLLIIGLIADLNKDYF